MSEVKNRVEVIVDGLKKSLDTEQLRSGVEEGIRREYNKGIDGFERKFVLRTNVLPNRDAVDFLASYTFENIKGMNDGLVNGLRQELSRAFINGESRSQIKKRVMKVLDVSESRAKAIARTESNRARNLGGLHAAEQSGLELDKIWFNPNPKSVICKHLGGQRKKVSEKFSYKGELFEAPPGHIGCQSRLLFVQRGDRVGA